MMFICLNRVPVAKVHFQRRGTMMCRMRYESVAVFNKFADVFLDALDFVQQDSHSDQVEKRLNLKREAQLLDSSCCAVSDPKAP